jgi:hypothetical protein
MKINHPLLKCEVVEIKPRIFVVTVKNDYDRSMLFCRYQEYYESPHSMFYRKFFTLEEFMKIYSKKRKTSFFSYPLDWIGFNIPSEVLIESHNLFKNSGSFYDDIMGQIISFCKKEINDDSKNWYLIGTDKLNSKILKHEISHGFYYTNVDYKKNMDKIIKKIDNEDFLLMKKKLILMGYRNEKKIIYDEIQAYMSSYKLPSWSDNIYMKYRYEFIEVFDIYK